MWFGIGTTSLFQRALVAETIKYELVGLVGRTLSGGWKKLEDVEKAFMFPSIFPLPEVPTII